LLGPILTGKVLSAIVLVLRRSRAWRCGEPPTRSFLVGRRPRLSDVIGFMSSSAPAISLTVVMFGIDQIRKWLRRVTRPAVLGTLRRTSPLSDVWGFDRGNAVDRFYIESFLTEYRRDIIGRALEVQDSWYTQRYGTGVTHRDILDIDASNKVATLVADLSAADALPSDTFDCFILTQTLQLIYDTRSAIRHAYRILRPGGVLLVTVPSVSRIVPDIENDYWRYTPSSCSMLFEEAFGRENTMVRSYGNVLACVAFLTGMAAEELSQGELERNDEAFPLIIGVRAVKTK
jgi:SAM-dependent methyltransferase